MDPESERRSSEESPAQARPAENPDQGIRISSLERALLDWRSVRDRVTDYLQALGLEEREVDRSSRRILERVLGQDSHRPAASDATDEVARLLLEQHPLASAPPFESIDDAFVRWRYAAWQRSNVPVGRMPEPTKPVATPPITRSSMVPERFFGRRLGERRRKAHHVSASDPQAHEREARRRSRAAWNRSGYLRRFMLAILVLVPSIVAGVTFLGTLPGRVWLPADLALAIFFGALFGWISLGFWTAVFGFLVQLRGGDGYAITLGLRTLLGNDAPRDPACRTALVIPICDEPVARVFAGLRAMRESLAGTGAGEGFDLFILSDSVDPDIASDELTAWANWRRDTEPGAGIYYRRRRIRQKRKSGNVADFCRRFGRQYHYMIVLDADSVMSGEIIVSLVDLMQAHPHVGIIQTAPKIVRARSLFARVQQFASRLYGPMFAAGLHYWQLGDCPYWGHNAILRVEPFMQHCALPHLAGNPPFGGEILSHDFVEAALLGRAGWSVWIAFDLVGSYEETPESLLEEMQRDQRWCQGNLQHLRLLFTEGLAPTHRALFLNGIFAYVSAALWLGFLVASTVEAALWAIVGPDYFAAGPSLFPTWPVWRPERVSALFVAVLILLFLPKILATLLALRADRGASFGGATTLIRSAFAESLASALLAPVRMAFYSRFVLRNMLGLAVGWGGGADEQGETTWRRAWRHHGLDGAVATVWAGTVYWLDPAAFWWLMPVTGALVLSTPLSVWASRGALGARARSAGWLLTPEELRPPVVVARLDAMLASATAERWKGFCGAVVDPFSNALHRMYSRGPRSPSPDRRAARAALIERALAKGPNALDAVEQRVLLDDSTSLGEIHRRVWQLGDRELTRRWGLGDPSAVNVRKGVPLSERG